MRKLIHNLMPISFFLIITGSTHGQQQSVRIEASFKPSVITLKSQTTYNVSIHGSSQLPEVKFPKVNGIIIDLNALRTSHFLTAGSFGASSVRQISFPVKPTKVGTFTIPQWPLLIEGKPFAVPPATLSVRPPSQEDIRREEIRKKQESDLKQALFLELSLDHDYLYKNQTVLTSINLFILQQLQVSDPRQMQKIGNAFSQSKINQPPEQRKVSRNGKTYNVYSWPVAITAVMEGNHDLQYSMIVHVQVSRRRGSPFNPLFNDPIFGFRQPVSVVSERYSIDVLPLPMDGRPTSFRGAIGSFKTQTNKDASRVTVGDPVRLTFAVTGEGNFGVMPAPELPSSDKIKIGPPAFLFEGNENLKYEGTQKFEYVVTPQNPGRLEIPAVPFSYFDPVNQNYVLASGKAQTIKVDPDETQMDPNLIAPTAEEKQSREANRKLFQTEPEPGNWESNLAPSSIFRSSTFWYVQIAPVFCFCTLLGWLLRKNRSSRDSLARRLAKLRAEMKTASRSNDSSAFLQAAKDAIRERTGALVKHERPEALARDEVLNILRKTDVSEETLSEVRDVLETVDAREFAEGDSDNLPLKEWFGRVNRLLKRMPGKA